MSCHEGHLQLRIDLPQTAYRFHAVPARRHPHIDERQRITSSGGCF